MYRNKVVKRMDNVVGSTSVFIDGGRPKCRLEECSFGSFMTDAMASEMEVDIALVNSGAIKGSFDPSKRNGKCFAASYLLSAKKKSRVVD